MNICVPYHQVRYGYPLCITASDIEPAQKKRKLSDSYVEKVIMGKELTDIHINIAQNLLKKQFPNLSGLQCTLLQAKETSTIDIKANKMLQIIHCLDHHHWIVATTIGSEKNNFVKSPCEHILSTALSKTNSFHSHNVFTFY